jgi:hypothetical protein
MSKSLKETYENGRKNNTAKTFILTSPDGEKFEVYGELKKFCKLKNISYATMSAAILYDRTGPRKNGWSIKELINI